jgi:hypothetical protein
MIKNDCAEKNKNRTAFTITLFSCPICRQTTLAKWYLRPINRLVLQELRKDDDYEHAYNEYKTKHGAIEKTEIPNNIDLATIAKNNRNDKMEILYKELLPILFEAAAEGKPFITISDKKKVREIQLIADLLAKKLFEQNKIYKLVATPNECAIEIISTNRSYKSEYINPELRRRTPLPPLPSLHTTLGNIFGHGV